MRLGDSIRIRTVYTDNKYVHGAEIAALQCSNQAVPRWTAPAWRIPMHLGRRAVLGTTLIRGRRSPRPHTNEG